MNTKNNLLFQHYGDGRNIYTCKIIQANRDACARLSTRGVFVLSEDGTVLCRKRPLVILALNSSTISSTDALGNLDKRRSVMNTTYGYICWNLPIGPCKQSNDPET